MENLPRVINANKRIFIRLNDEVLANIDTIESIQRDDYGDAKITFISGKCMTAVNYDKTINLVIHALEISH